MRAEWNQLEHAVEEFVDGKPVDWTTATQRASGSAETAAIESLRSVEAIAQFGAERRHLETVPLEEDDASPERWGELTLLEKLGRGSTADVFRVKDATLNMDLALKLPRREQIDEGEHRRLIEEARALAHVNHPSVVRVYRVEEHDDRAGIVMEWVRGETLNAIIRKNGPLGEDVATQYGRTIAEALAAIHGQELIHRDVKAQNVVVAEGGRLVLMDLGCCIHRMTSESRQGNWGMEGTPYYMAPEVLAGEPASFLSDVYSLGVLLYFLVTGAYPVEGRTLEALRRNHTRPREKTLLDRRPDLSGDFVAVVERALHHDPSRRYSSAGQLAAALVELQRNRIPAAETAGPRVRVRSGPAFPLRLILATAVVALLGWAAVQFFAGPAALDVDLALYRQTASARERLVSGDAVSPGDLLVLEMRSTDPAYMYILSQDDRGVASLLFPLPQGDLSNPVAGDGPRVLPGTVNGRNRGWRIGAGAGAERILVVASAARLPAMEELLAAVPAAGNAAMAYAEVSHEALGELRGILELGELPPGANAGAGFDGLFERAKDVAAEGRGLLVRSFEFVNRGD